MALIMDDVDEESLMEVDVLHPEVLSSSQLSQLLKQRNIPIENSNPNLDRDKLLEMFYRTILPLPQRDYRPNRRGQLLMRKRSKLLGKHKMETSVPSVNETRPVMKTPRLMDATLPKATSEVSSRLKPPPNPVSAEKKTVRLNTKSFNGSEVVKTEASTASKSNKKIITLINKTLMSNAKTISSSNGSDKELCTKEKNCQEDDCTPKKKHKPITWP